MNRTLCIQTVLTLIMTAGAIAIGYTNFVQADLSEEIERIHKNQSIENEKITSIQITLAEIQKDIDFLRGGK